MLLEEQESFGKEDTRDENIDIVMANEQA